MPRELEKGIYMFRIKFTSMHDGSLEIHYQRHHVQNLAHIPEIMERINNYFSRIAKGKLDVTYKYESEYRGQQHE